MKGLVFAVLGVMLFPIVSLANEFEISLSGSFRRSAYTAGNYAWTRRWSGSVGYHVSGLAEIEFAFQDVVDRTLLQGYEDTTFHDKIYSANWVQSLWGREWMVQPYGKVGIGQLNRDASGSYATGESAVVLYDRLTGVLGVGARLRLMQNLAIRCEATTYLSGANIQTWQDNVSFVSGLSILF